MHIFTNKRKTYLALGVLACGLLLVGIIIPLALYVPTGEVDLYPGPPYTVDTFPVYPGANMELKGRTPLDVDKDGPGLLISYCVDGKRDEIEAFYTEVLTEGGWKTLAGVDYNDPYYHWDGSIHAGRPTVESYALSISVSSECDGMGGRARVGAFLTADLPVPPEAMGTIRGLDGGIDTLKKTAQFQIDGSPDKVQAFYKELLAKKGWHVIKVLEQGEIPAYIAGTLQFSSEASPGIYIYVETRLESSGKSWVKVTKYWA